MPEKIKQASPIQEKKQQGKHIGNIDCRSKIIHADTGKIGKIQEEMFAKLSREEEDKNK